MRHDVGRIRVQPVWRKDRCLGGGDGRELTLSVATGTVPGPHPESDAPSEWLHVIESVRGGGPRVPPGVIVRKSLGRLWVAAQGPLERRTGGRPIRGRPDLRDCHHLSEPATAALVAHAEVTVRARAKREFRELEARLAHLASISARRPLLTARPGRRVASSPAASSKSFWVSFTFTTVGPQ